MPEYSGQAHIEYFLGTAGIRLNMQYLIYGCMILKSFFTSPGPYDNKQSAVNPVKKNSI
jgi:hypothetical protein